MIEIDVWGGTLFELTRECVLSAIPPLVYGNDRLGDVI